MGLALDSITRWVEMEKFFLDKYQEYYRVKYKKDELNFKKRKRRSESKILKFQKRYKFKKTVVFD